MKVGIIGYANLNEITAHHAVKTILNTLPYHITNIYHTGVLRPVGRGVIAHKPPNIPITCLPLSSPPETTETLITLCDVVVVIWNGLNFHDRNLLASVYATRGRVKLWEIVVNDETQEMETIREIPYIGKLLEPKEFGKQAKRFRW